MRCLEGSAHLALVGVGLAVDSADRLADACAHTRAGLALAGVGRADERGVNHTLVAICLAVHSADWRPVGGAYRFNEDSLCTYSVHEQQGARSGSEGSLQHSRGCPVAHRQRSHPTGGCSAGPGATGTEGGALMR